MIPAVPPPSAPLQLREVPPRAGWAWLRAGLRVFARQPLAIGGLFLMSMMGVMLVSLLPLVGTLVALALLPAISLGLMLAARTVAEGRFPMPQVLLAGFRESPDATRHMAVLGIIYAVAFLGILAASALADGGKLARLYLLGGQISEELVRDAQFRLAVWISFALYLPLTAAFWHAPALVCWNAVPPVKALFFSAVACWRNRGAFLVYGLACGGVFMAALMAVGLLTAALSSPVLTSGLTMGLVLITAAVFFSSVYFSYRDCFTTGAPGA